MAGRTIAIGDVHGCLAALDAVVAAVGLQPTDTLVMLGDCVDRGPASCQVIERLLQLRTEVKLIPILGNHEEMMLAAARQTTAGNDWLVCGGRDTLESYGVARPIELPPAHLRYIAEWRDYYETDDYFFAHGNYDASLPLDDQAWDELRWRPLRWHLPGRHTSGKRAVLGHSSQKNGEVLELSQLVCIDTYCHGGGWLTAFCPETDEYWQADAAGNLRAR